MSGDPVATSGLDDRLSRLIGCQKQELRPALWAFAYFFCLLAGYYVVRPLRDEMGIRGGVDGLQWLFTGTFMVMLVAVPLFGALTARYARRRFLPAVYLFFIANMLIFWVGFRSDLGGVVMARGFFIWTSVFNLFVVSVFWSLMADLFDRRQAARIFGFVAAGGSTGAIAGPALTTQLAPLLGADNLLLVSAALFGLAMLCMSRVVRSASPEISAERQAEADQAMGGSILEGLYLVLRSPYLLGICLLMLLTTSMATFLYFQQARIVSELFTSSEQRTAVFGAIDLAVNISALTLQIFGTNRLVRRLGVPAAIALVPVLMVLVFVGLGVAPVLSMLVIAQVIRRGGNYGLMRPCREMLFTVVGRRAKYKAKNFIDTVVYRGGDAVSAWVYAGLAALGLGVGQTALVAAPVAGLWAVIAWRLGRSLESHEDTPPGPAEPSAAAEGPKV